VKNGIEKMKKNRNIPFGYTMQKGEIIAEPTESQAVKDIFILIFDEKKV
jgi:hypothetical protein